MKWFKLIISVVITCGVFYLLDNQFGQIPPAGKFFSPFSGFWQNNTSLDNLPVDVEIDGLKDIVTIVWDERRVPHIFAQNENDLYIAQGYVVANDRLWQMDFIPRATGGRLSEILGKDLLEYDKYNRRLGKVFGAENMIKALNNDPDSEILLTAYAAGVNSYIESLPSEKYPVEYKVFNYKPEKWSPIKTALLYKSITWDMTGAVRDDFTYTNMKLKIGEDNLQKLFPFYRPFSDPIIPEGTIWDFNPEIPDTPASNSVKVLSSTTPVNTQKEYTTGSNNWAVSGTKTSSGYPILSNDPHLSLTLPSFWYEMQLSAPGINIYGMSVPGTPGISIGFNKDISWGITNGGSDVLDWYKIKFKNDSYDEYLYDGEYRKTTKKVEKYLLSSGEVVLDTVIYTHHGPVVYLNDENKFEQNIPTEAALRWIGHDPALDVKTFTILNRAKNYNDYLKAMEYFSAPLFNFVYADRDGNIAVSHQGKVPLRWPGQGFFVLDGANPEHGWSGYIPHDQMPRIKNPARGYVSSANQIPADPNYPYYLGKNYETYTRGSRISTLLRDMSNIIPDEMRLMQMDDNYPIAQTAVPIMLKYLEDEQLNDEEQKIYMELNGWNFNYDADLIAPSIFDEWWKQIVSGIWEDELKNEGPFRYPPYEISLDLLLNNPDSDYFDNITTDSTETVESTVSTAFDNTLRSLTKEYGSLGAAWKWGNVKQTDINHLGRIPGFGVYNLETSGNARIVNATGKAFGPSFRMVVALGPEPEAWVEFPGGQSGNPGSAFYQNMVSDWVSGNNFKVLFLNHSDEKHPQIAGKTILRPLK